MILDPCPSLTVGVEMRCFGKVKKIVLNSDGHVDGYSSLFFLCSDYL